MKLKSLVLALVVVASLAGVAYVSQQSEGQGVTMTAAAQRFVDALTPAQKEKALFPFDSKERTNWYFVPREANKKSIRKGLPLEDMTADQKKLAINLLGASTSASGKMKAETIMSLESILKELEKGRGPVRNPEWYFVTVFGSPSKTGKWGWRIEGHHLALNFTVSGGDVISATPAVFGANPALVKSGPRKGLETLPEVEKLARELYLSLDKDQQKVAYSAKQFPEPQQALPLPKVGPPVGLPADRMNEKQKQTLMRLIEAYTNRNPEAVAQAQMKEIKAGGLDKVYFAWNGSTEPGEKHTYRVQGSNFVIEFLNTQTDAAGNQANHIHSALRFMNNDFGLGAKK
jgi:hypothetical protein